MGERSTAAQPQAQGVALSACAEWTAMALYVVNHLPHEYAAILPEIRRTSTASLYWTLREQCGVEVAGSSRTLEAVCRAVFAGPPPGRSEPVSYSSTSSRSPGTRPASPSTATGRGCAQTGLRIAVETDTWTSLAGRVVSHSFVGVPNDGAVARRRRFLSAPRGSSLGIGTDPCTCPDNLVACHDKAG